MAKQNTNPDVDFIFGKEDKWQSAITLLRKIILDCGLTEELKWGQACYIYGHTNVVLIHTFKDYCALLFFKGALLNDPEKLLVQQTQNVQAARQLRFTSAKEINNQKTIIKNYVYEAIEVERAGLTVKLKKTSEFNMPDEFHEKISKNKALKKAFEALTPGRQRGYLLYFSSAKQEKTREERIKKYTPHILKGKGLND